MWALIKFFILCLSFFLANQIFKWNIKVSNNTYIVKQIYSNTKLCFLNASSLTLTAHLATNVV